MPDLKLQLVIDALNNSGHAWQEIRKSASDVGERINGLFERVNRTTEGIVGAAGQLGIAFEAGFKVKQVIESADALDRMRIMSGRTQEEIGQLNDRIFDTAKAARIQKSELDDALSGMRSGGGDIDLFKKSLDPLATEIQLLNGHGYELGETFANLANSMNIKEPQKLAETFSFLRKEMKSVGGKPFEDLAPRFGEDASQYVAVTKNTGIGAARDLGSVLALAARGASSTREANSALQGVMASFGDADLRRKLYFGTGVNAFDVHNPGHMRPMLDVIEDLGHAYASSPMRRRYIENDLKPLFDPLRAVFADFANPANHGRSPLIDRARSITADPEQDKRMADEIGKSVTGAKNAASTAIDQLLDSIAVKLQPVSRLVGEHSDTVAQGAVFAATIGGAASAVGVARYSASQIAGVGSLFLGAINGTGRLIAPAILQAATALEGSAPRLASALLSLSAGLETGIGSILASAAPVVAAGAVFGASSLYGSYKVGQYVTGQDKNMSGAELAQDAALSLPGLGTGIGASIWSARKLYDWAAPSSGAAPEGPRASVDFPLDKLQPLISIPPQKDAQNQPPQKSQLTVTFEGLPNGMRIRDVRSSDPNTVLDTRQGVSMVTP